MGSRSSTVLALQENAKVSMTRSNTAKKQTPCMPPLLEEETIPFSREDGSTNFGGTACENIVKSYFLSRNTNIAEPHVDNGVDLLIETDDGWKRGQVKKVVYQLKLDYTHKKKFGNEIYRSRFSFSFQGGGSKPSQRLKKGRRQRGPETIDYFYHVLLTKYRQLIWEIPSSIIPLRPDGTFIQNKDAVLERSNWLRKKSDINFNDHLVYATYDPIVYKTYPMFFQHVCDVRQSLNCPP